MAYLSENLRFLLWNKGVKREEWITTLATWLRTDISRAQALLFENSKIRSLEIKNLIKAIHFVDKEEFLEMRLVVEHEVDIPLMNINYLIDSLPRGQRKVLAESLNVHEVTISRWYGGVQIPSERHYEALSKFFGIPADLDIRTDPIFLSLDPVTDDERKQWLMDRIAKLSTTKLSEIFPVLKLVLKDDQSNDPQSI